MQHIARVPDPRCRHCCWLSFLPGFGREVDATEGQRSNSREVGAKRPAAFLLREWPSLHFSAKL